MTTNDPRLALKNAQRGLAYSRANELILIPADAKRTALMEYAVSERQKVVDAIEAKEAKK